jgi:hypothetical protein
MAVVVALASIALVVAAFTRRELIDLRADDYVRSIRRFAAGRGNWSSTPAHPGAGSRDPTAARAGAARLTHARGAP